MRMQLWDVTQFPFIYAAWVNSYSYMHDLHFTRTIPMYVYVATVYWGIFEVQNFRGWVPFANKFSRMAFL